MSTTTRRFAVKDASSYIHLHPSSYEKGKENLGLCGYRGGKYAISVNATTCKECIDLYWEAVRAKQ